MYSNLDHDAVYKVYPEAVTFSDAYGAFDKNGNPIKLDVLKIEQESIKLRESKKIDFIKDQRTRAYSKESDPLFFKVQRGEATKEEWEAKIEEIRARYPYPS